MNRFLRWLLIKLLLVNINTNLASKSLKEDATLVTGWGFLIGASIGDIARVWGDKKTYGSVLNRKASLQELFVTVASSFRIPWSKKREIKNGFLLIARHGPTREEPNYAHWLLENLPVIRQFFELPQYTYLIIRKDSPKWIYESLIAVGVSPDQIIEAGGGLKVDHLYLPQVHFFNSRSVDHSNGDRAWLRERLRAWVRVNVKSIPRPEKIYVSRQSARRRRIVNFVSIHKVLSRFGFSIWEPETSDFEDQSALFFCAKVILAQPGAAMANLIFSSQGIRVFEIEGFENVSCWKILCDELNIEYVGLGCSFQSGLHSDVFIEVDVLTNKLGGIN